MLVTSAEELMALKTCCEVKLLRTRNELHRQTAEAPVHLSEVLLCHMSLSLQLPQPCFILTTDASMLLGGATGGEWQKSSWNQAQDSAAG
jgi:hypothetical protein